MDWGMIAGGRCEGKVWRVGVAGIQLDSEEVFILGVEQWERLTTLLPLNALQAYGNANGMCFERVVATGLLLNYDAILVIEQRRGQGGVLAIPGNVRRYLLLLQPLEGKTRLFDSFDRVFLPARAAFTGQHKIRLNQPLNIPMSDLPSFPAFSEGVNVYGRDDIEINQAHFALCGDDPEVPGWLAADWERCLLSGVVPVRNSSASIPDWFPCDCYVDGAAFSNEMELYSYLDSMNAADYEAVASRLRSFLMQGSSRPDERIYPYTVDYWINAVTSVVALDASEVRGYEPLVSVIIPAFNYGRYLHETVSSLLAQGVDSIEVLVIDNASTDETAEVMEVFSSDSRVRYMRNRRNFGAGNNSHNGFWTAKGKYLVLFMADDFMSPGHLSRLLRVMEKDSKFAVGYSPVRFVDENGNPMKVPSHPGHRETDYVGGRNEVADLLVYDNYITPSAAVIRRRAFFQAWQRDTRVRGAGDWLLMIQLAELFPDFVFSAIPGVCYRVHTDQHSVEYYQSTAPLENHILILEGVFARGAKGRLRGQEHAVIEHLRRRLELYPSECSSPLGQRVHELCERLGEQAGSTETALFSVILTTYNRPVMLLDALRSLAAQSQKDFEVILVNDHGEPVEALLGEFEFPLTYLYQGRNQGLSAARNAGLALATGRYVCYLDDDDLYSPQHLEILAKAFETAGDAVVYTGYDYVAEQLEDGKRIELSRRVGFEDSRYDQEHLFINNYIPVNTWAHPRSLLQVVGQFDTTLTAFEDWDMLLRLAVRYPVIHVPEVTVEVRTRSQQSEADDSMLRRERERFAPLYQEIYRRYSDLGSERVRKGRAAQLRSLGVVAEGDPTPVRTWLSARKLTAPQQRLASDYVTAHRDASARLTVILLDLSGDTALRQRSLDSLVVQVDAGNINMHVMSVDAAPATSAEAWTQCSGQSWTAQLNAKLAQLDCDWVMLLRAGEELVVSGLQMLSLELLANPDCRAIFADALFRQDGSDYGVALRPDFNLDYLLSFPRGLSANWLFRREVLLALGGFPDNDVEVMELGAILGLINQQGGIGIGHVAEPLVLSDAPVLSDSATERAAVLRHVQARGYEQAQVQAVRPGQYRVDYGHAEQPLVSVVVVVEDQMAAAQRCVMGLLEHTRYPHYEILLIDNASEQPATREWLQSVDGMGSERLKVLRSPERLAYSELCNQAALNIQGDYLLLLRAEVAVLDSDWLDALMNHALRPEVGAVGPRLVDADGKITHAGLILGLRGAASSPFVGEPVDAPGYMQRLQVDQNPSALGDACLLVRKSVFVELGGLDAGALDGQAAVIDFCLRLADGGHLLVWTPSATLLHASEPSGMTVEMEDALYQRWLPRLARDAAYNANFSLVRKGGFQLTDPQISWRPLDIWRPQPVVLAHPADVFGCGHYRVIQPFNALLEAGLVDGALSQGLMHAADLERYAPDVVILQRQIGDERLEAMRRMRAFSSAFKVYELDDYLPNLPMKSAHRSKMPKDIVRSLRRGLSLVDRFVVSTEPLAEALSGYHPDIRVVHNRLDPRWWGQLPVSKRGQSHKPRVGWAGGSSHTGDLELIRDVVKELAGEVEWVFFGMCPDSLRPYVHEFHPGVPINLYPRKLAELKLDLALAPVEENLFNECKSNLRLLEYGACGYPVVCSDVRCYAGDLPVTRVKNRYRDWVDAIRMHLSDADASAVQGKALQETVLSHWMLDEQGLIAWQQGWLP